MSHKSQISVWVAVVLGLLLAFGNGAQAQTEEAEVDAPQFLYRNGENLILVNALTGEAETLPGITVGERDQFEWSPDGQYLLLETETNGGFNPHCLNIYSVDERTTVTDNPISCAVEDEEFSPDSTHIAFSTLTNDDVNGVLWLLALSDQTTTRIHETTEGSRSYRAGIADIRWSPLGHYISYISWRWINGGSINSLNIFDVETRAAYLLNTHVDSFLASYDPVWSPDENWFLLVLKEQYVTMWSMPYTNHKGDLYLVRSETGEMQRLTYTPAEQELNPHWAEDGQIAYSVTQNIRLSIDDALNVQAPPPDTIVEPEPIDLTSERCTIMLQSSDPALWAGVCLSKMGPNHVFSISVDGRTTYEVELPNGNNPNILIGWRPQ